MLPYSGSRGGMIDSRLRRRRAQVGHEIEMAPSHAHYTQLESYARMAHLQHLLALWLIATLRYKLCFCAHILLPVHILTCMRRLSSPEIHFFSSFCSKLVCWRGGGRLPRGVAGCSRSTTEVQYWHSVFSAKIWERGVLWHSKSAQSAKVFSAKIIFFTNLQKFSPPKVSR